MGRGWKSVLLLISMMALGQARAEAKLNVVATTEHYAAIAKIVGGDRIAVAYLARGDQDPHAIEPKRSFSVLLNRADLLIVNGQDLEAAWLPIALADSPNSRIREGKPGYLDASRGANLIPYDPAELERPFLFNVMVALHSLFGKGGQEVQLGSNHHYWLDPANGEAIARTIFERLALLDPSHAESYQANYERFASRLKEKLEEWDTLMKPFEGTQIVSYHRSWAYLARRHGIKILDYVEPKESFVQGPTNVYHPLNRDEISSLTARMRRGRVKLVVAETYQDQAIAEHIARRAGARLLILPSSVSENEGIEDYFQLFDRMYQELSRALRRSGG